MTDRRDDRAVPRQEGPPAYSVRKSVVGPPKPLWVRTWRSVHVGWLIAFVGLAGASVAILVTLVLLFEPLPPDVLMGLLWPAFLVIVALGQSVVMSGVGSVRLSRFVRPIEVAAEGRGLSVPGRGDFLIRSFIFALAVLFGFSYFYWRDDEPGRRQFRAEISTLVGAPVVLLCFVLGFVIVNRTRISLHPDGIVQEIYRRRAWKVTSDVTVVPWDGIVGLQPQTHPNPAVPHPHLYPTVRVVYREADSESDQELILMVCEKKVEPNSLLALLQWCRDNPWAREQLGHDDARELLRPPSLLERIRADRAASISVGRNGVQ
ncbi:hypothetical protein CH286_16865 [Rhodococcus sp. WWJCD1]|uniref:hypothetical protein n=1 Tax=Rhodococcus sp. WWJCD1 TaxID=2022519 RepID=UPI000B9BF97E|nr:hypothetical protein [Rhodococcus sp. WWJCD1]OZC45703.1 hypothetical protein CH286_16865 [Rhodococcus sp. WWJCD1]